MKIVKESINEIKRSNVTSLGTIGAGKISFVRDWVDSHTDFLTNHVINADGTITADNVRLHRPLPEYVQFDTVGDMYISGDELSYEEIISALPRKLVNTIYIVTDNAYQYGKKFANDVKAHTDMSQYADIIIRDRETWEAKNLTKGKRNKEQGGPIKNRFNFMEAKRYELNGSVKEIEWAPGYVTYWQLKYIQSKGDEGAYYMNVFMMSDVLRYPGKTIDKKLLGKYAQPWKKFVEPANKEGWWRISPKGKKWLADHIHFERQEPDLSDFVEIPQRNRINPYRQKT